MALGWRCPVPSQPDELVEKGIKMETDEDFQRWKDFGLPTSTFLSGKFPGKNVAKVNSCFAKSLKKRRLELYDEDPDENKFFLMFHQGAWRTAYFEDDRDLMEEVVATTCMKQTIKRHWNIDISGGAKRQMTLDDFSRR